MINRVILTGRITKDIELRQTNTGTVFAYFTIAVRRFPSANREISTDFIPCVAWDQTAEMMDKTLHKGSLIAVEGKINVYQNQKDGQYDTRVNVNVSQFFYLEPKRQDTTNEYYHKEVKNNDELFFENGGRVNFDDLDQKVSSHTEEINLDDIKL